MNGQVTKRLCALLAWVLVACRGPAHGATAGQTADRETKYPLVADRYSNFPSQGDTLYVPITLQSVPLGLRGPLDVREGDAVRVVVRDSAHWSTVWNLVTHDKNPPHINFARDMVIMAATETQGTMGWGISIDTVYSDGGAWLYAVVRELPSCGGPDYASRPIAAVTVPRSGSMGVRFIERGLKPVCEN